MINEISVTLDDEGRYLIKMGDSMVVLTTNESELMGFIYDQLDSLAYFPNSNMDFNKNAISILEFRKKHGRVKVRRKLIKDTIE